MVSRFFSKKLKISIKILKGSMSKFHLLVHGKHLSSLSFGLLIQDVLWGQSLHFDLDEGSSKYLNITVRAKPSDGKQAGYSGTTEDSVSQMLGYVGFKIGFF